MKKNIIYKNFIHKKHLSSKLNNDLKKDFSNVIQKIKKNIKIPRDVFFSLNHKFNYSFNFKDLNKFKKFKTVVIIGMGGSILGPKAIYYFLENKIKKKFIFFDNINENKLEKIKKEYNLNKVLFIVISKSGETIETLSNFLSFKIIKKRSKNIIIISEKKDNTLFMLSKKFNLFHISHKNYIGGRYSIFTEVGVVPAYLMGVNIKKFKENVINFLEGQGQLFLKDSSIKISNLTIKKRFKNIILFNYTPKLDKFLYWLQQLIAESLGKKKLGFLPVISKAPKDHHSMLQLYLDGPKDEIFYIFSNQEKNYNKITANFLDKKLKHLNKKNLNDIKKAQKESVILELKKHKIPFREFEIKAFNEQTLGELFAFFILEVFSVGSLSKVNPFDQPAVEIVKKNTLKKLT